jgi:hypothetical protein
VASNVQTLKQKRILILKTIVLKALMVIMDFSNRVTSSMSIHSTQGKKDLKDIADYYRRVSGNQLDMKTDS